MKHRADEPGENDTTALNSVKRSVEHLGPGIVTGAADDDPSGISTYTITGAQYGYQLLWTSLITLPMNFAVQSACARVGIVTGRGLAAAITERFGRKWLYPVVFFLLVANVVNIGADIGAVAAAIALLTPLPSRLLIPVVGVTIALVEVVVPYRQFARWLKLLTLVIFAYVLTAFVANADWGAALRATIWPRMSLTQDSIATVVAILGTTISPYLFFWQASQEVEEVATQDKEHRGKPDSIRDQLRAARIDVATGMVLANIGFYFVVVTAAATLYAGGERNVQTAAEAAQVLRPLAGSAAELLFAVGIIGTGLLAIPVLAGSGAYATAELFGWVGSLNKTFRRAPQFYGMIALATLLGIGIEFSGVSEVRALYIAAIVNGLISPILLVFLVLVAGDRRVMGEFASGRGISAMGWLTTVTMSIAALALLATLIRG